METNIYGDVLAVTCDDGTRHLIPLDAIASWDELLGCDTDMEAVAAIIRVRSNRSDPGVACSDWTRCPSWRMRTVGSPTRWPVWPTASP